MSDGLTPEQIAEFNEQGFLILRGLASPCLDDLATATRAELAQPTAPLELETEVRYPGSPDSVEAEGGRTVRRLLQAFDRNLQYAAWATGPRIGTPLAQLLGAPPLLARAHHNCLMTKQPSYSSDTNWHRDIRYWHYTQRELISVWTALGHEYRDNGGLSLIPRSHRIELPPDHFDERLFVIPDKPRSAELIATAQTPELEPGDVLFFHCRTLHAANRNRTDRVKLSLVFTYRTEADAPRPGSRSDRGDDVPLAMIGTDREVS